MRLGAPTAAPCQPADCAGGLGELSAFVTSWVGPEGCRSLGCRFWEQIDDRFQGGRGFQADELQQNAGHV